jgi:hypothetical protein
MKARGFNETRLAMGRINRQLVADLYRATIQRAARIQAGARQRAPVDTGKLRSEIFSQIRAGRGRCIATVGTKFKYGWYMEFGFAKAQAGKPPPYKEGTPLHGWASRHGLPPVYVSRLLAGQWKKGMRTHIKKRPYLVPAWNENRGAFLEDVKAAVLKHVTFMGPKSYV